MSRARFAVLVGLAALGCEEPLRFPAPAAVVRIMPDSVTLAPGQSLQLTTVIEDSAGEPVRRAITWRSSDARVATVTTSGVVTAVGGGRATITAVVDAVSGEAAVVVHVPVAEVTIDLGDQHLVTGGTLRFRAVPRDATGQPLVGRPLTWSITDTSVAALALDPPDAIVTGLAAGSTTLTATSETQQATVELTVATVRFVGVWAAESNHTCALTGQGVAYCWGADEAGQLGNGIAPASAAPSRVAGPLTFARVSPGGRFTCALSTGADPFCWGNGVGGRLGNGSLENSATPVAVASLQRMREMSSGWGLTCGLTAAGRAYCWGNGGGLGFDTLKFSTLPIPVGGDLSLRAVGVGYRHGCAIGTDATARCWGTNLEGRLGRADVDYTDVPLPVSGGLAFDSLVAGPLHVCALTSAGAAYCWGGNPSGQLGNGSETGGADPVAVAGGHSFWTLSAGNAHTCGLTADGTAWCWGANAEGRLGLPPGAQVCGTMPCSTTPVPVSGDLRFVTIVAGGVHTCGVATDGLAYCWGGNAGGQLGDGTTASSSAPVRVLGQITAASAH